MESKPYHRGLRIRAERPTPRQYLGKNKSNEVFLKVLETIFHSAMHIVPCSEFFLIQVNSKHYHHNVLHSAMLHLSHYST